MARVFPTSRRHWLAGISLFGLLAWAQLLPAAPLVAAETANIVTSASNDGSGSTVTVTPTATPAFTRTSTIAPTIDPIDPRITINNVMAVLQSSGAISAGGRLLFSVPDSYAITSSIGENFLPLGDGQIAQDFVLAVQMGWFGAGSGSACGISFREGPSDWWSVLLTSDGRLLLARQMGTTRIIDADLPIQPFDSKPYRNALWLTANGSNLTVYLNGQALATVTDTTTRGGFALDVYNVPNNTVFTDCRYRNFWVWSYDNGTSTNTPTITTTSSQQ